MLPDLSAVAGPLLVAAAYLVGSIPFGMVVARVSGKGIDLRKVGSGNIGATNVSRALGKGAGAVTLLLDAGKAVFALTLTSLVMGGSSHGWLALAGGAVFLGHVFPVYLRFKGGKGVATAMGVVAFLSPVTLVVLLAVFAAVVYLTRFISLGSLCAAVGLPVMVALLEGPRSYLNLALLIAFVVFYTHRVNIHRLLAGEEPRFGISRKA